MLDFYFRTCWDLAFRLMLNSDRTVLLVSFGQMKVFSGFLFCPRITITNLFSFFVPSTADCIVSNDGKLVNGWERKTFESVKVVLRPQGGSRWRRKKSESSASNMQHIPFYSHFALCICALSCYFRAAPLFHLLISRPATFALSCFRSNFLFCLDRLCLSPTRNSSAPNSSGCWNFQCLSLCGHSLSEYFSRFVSVGGRHFFESMHNSPYGRKKIKKNKK